MDYFSFCLHRIRQKSAIDTGAQGKERGHDEKTGTGTADPDGPAVLERLKTGREKGLSPGQVQQRQAVWGKNELEGAKKEGPLRRFFRQFADFMILVLLAAALISGGVSLWQGEGCPPTR